MKHNPQAIKRQKRACPIPRLEDIGRIRKILKPKIRDLLLFDLAVETGVAANQILQLRVKDLSEVNVGEKIAALDGKQGRIEPITMGPNTHKSLQNYLEKKRPHQDDFIFKSRKGNNALSLPSASRLVSSWFATVGLKEMSGFLSLRKTWETQFEKTDGKKTPPRSNEPLYPVNSIKTPTVQERVYKALEHALVTARIEPGERLVAEKLARQMGISMIPIREAIGRLEARNFLTVQPKKGAIVNELSEKRFKEILEIRLMLELPAAQKAAIAAEKDTIKKIERLNSRYVAAQQRNDADNALSQNREFHFTIYRKSNRPLLLSMIKNLWDQVSPYYHLMFRQTLFNDPYTGPVYHDKIIQGMAERDSQKVSKWLEIDLTESADFVIQVMREMQQEKTNWYRSTNRKYR